MLYIWQIMQGEKQAIGPKARWAGIVLCLALLAPSFSINNIDSHDWGGDFALYIRQAMNMVDGIPQSETGYIYNAENAILSPTTYPVGLPLMLAPVYAICGNDIGAFIDLMAVLSVLFGLAIFVFLRERIGLFIALLIAIGITYHPTILWFKREVMADIPFAMLSLLSLYLLGKKRWWMAFPALLLAMLTKTIGITLLVAAAVMILLDLVKQKEGLRAFFFKHHGVQMLVLTVLSYVFINRILFAVDPESGYATVFSGFNLGEVIEGNASFYWDFLCWFLTDEHYMTWIGKWITGTMLVMALLAWVRKIIKDVGITEIWVPIYIMVLLLYPYRGAALRFLLPVIPVLFYYTSSFFYHSRMPWKKVFAIIAITPFLFIVDNTKDLMHNNPQYVSGPQSDQAQKLFAFIRKKTAEDATFLFSKPRVLALYTDRSAMCNGRLQDASSIIHQLDSIPIDYVLQAQEPGNVGLDSLLVLHPERVEEIYAADGFHLFRWKKGE